MDAAGLQKNSLIDYPGKIACVVFLSGCNFTCPYCHNPELARGEYPVRLSLDELTAFIQRRRTLLDAVVITGGEPTLQPDLAHWCRTFRQLGLAVKLDTNGSRPEMLEQLIAEGVLDFIAMDIKTAPEAYGPPLCSSRRHAAIAKSAGLVAGSGLAYEFRTTCVRPFIDRQHIAAIGRLIQGAAQWTLQTFRPDNILNPDFFTESTSGFTPEEMADLQTIAAAWVQRCTVR